VRDALTHAVDLTSPARKSQLRVLASFCDDADPGKRRLLALCAKSGKDAYAREIVQERASTLDLLNMAPSCFGGTRGKDDFGAFLDAAPPLQPRMYSITTAPETAPATPAVAFSVVRFASPAGATREGVATNWLDRLDDLNTARVPVFIKRSVAFRPPDSLATPTLMIGPGTGVAPFRGFLQRRAAALARATPAEKDAIGPCWLFFGCRRAEEDFLYREDLEGFRASGVLDALHCAFSRENEGKNEKNEKTYVQHLIREKKQSVGALVAAPGARVYVCGDGGGMAKDVHAALRDALATLPEVADEQAAEAALAAMTREGRYVRDIWS
jgi:NADPH-ferrihemoprotein reductase